MLGIGLSALAAACGSQEPNVRAEPLESPEDALMEANSDQPVILAFGDSLTVGHGVERSLSYPAQLQAELGRRGYRYRVINLGQDGDTTSGGVARLDMALELRPEIVILELGGNDGLRGLPVSVVRDNLRTMIQAFNESGSQVILAGMSLPRNYGPDYIQDFESVYVDLADELDVVLMPFFLDGLVEEYERYIQPDGIHPTGEGYAIVTSSVFETIEPYLTH